jgi:hypothetical protein
VIEKAYPELDYEFQQSKELMNKMRSKDYAQRFYAALCNNFWRKEGYVYNDQKPWAVTWRTAGGIASGFHHGDDRLSDYMEFYCSGGEGEVDPEIQQDLYDLGWDHEPIAWQL